MGPPPPFLVQTAVWWRWWGFLVGRRAWRGYVRVPRPPGELDLALRKGRFLHCLGSDAGYCWVLMEWVYPV